MKLIGYVRVSTDEQARQGVSLAQQEEKIRAYADLHGEDLVEVVRDEGFSGKNLKRPGLTDAVERVLYGDADALIVYRLDRLSRSTRDFLNLMAEFDRRGRDFVSVREQMNTHSPHGRFTLTLLASVAQLERELISERCKDATARCRLELRAYSRTPFGYDRDGKRLIENPEEQAAIQRMLVMREDGASLRQIAKRLNALGIRAKRGGGWSQSNVDSVLKSWERFAPTREYQRELKLSSG